MLLGDEAIRLAVKMQAMGSTMPDSAPMAKALFLLIPSECNGIESMAPSGKFCMAMPMANAHAADIGMAAPSAMADAKMTPTAIPSGMLWRVTATASMVLRFHCFLGASPSGCEAPICK